MKHVLLPKTKKKNIQTREKTMQLQCFVCANSTYWLMINTGRANLYRQDITWAVFSGKTSTARNWFWNKKEEKTELNVSKYSQVYDDYILCG